MSGCSSVHEHSEFQSSYDPKDKVQNQEVQKLKRFLKSNVGHSIGEQLRYELSSFKSFPRKHKSTRCIFILLRRRNRCKIRRAGEFSAKIYDELKIIGDLPIQGP